MVPAPGDQADGQAADRAHDQADPHLLEQHPAQGRHVDLAGGETAYDDGRRLAADVAAHAGDDRNKRDQCNNIFQGHFKQPHQVASRDPSEEVGQQPGQTQPGDLEGLMPQ